MRSLDSGVTLLEMLVALSVSAMVGVAGLTFLDNLTRIETHTSGRLDALARYDRAFFLLATDLDAAHQVRLEEALTIEAPDLEIVWHPSVDGLVRRIERTGQPPITQHLLDVKTELRMVEPDLFALELQSLDLYRLFQTRQTTQ